MKKKILACILAVAMLITMLAGCGTKTANESKNTPKAVKDKVVISIGSDLTNLDPLNNASTDSYMYCNIYDPLVNRDKDGNFIPVLADSWTLSDDSLTYTFKLKQGVKFHNGEELKASDVVFTMNEAKKSPYTKETMAPIKEVSAVDDYTVNIKLTAPFAPFLLNVAGIPILNEKAYTEAKGNYGKDNAVGTGPYKFVKHDLGQSVVFTRFDDYYGEKPAIKDVEFKIITDENSSYVALQSGDVDMAFRIASVSLKSAKNNPKLAIHDYNSLSLVFVVFNNGKKPFDNVKVRQAINYAIDKDSIIQMVYEGGAKKANCIVNDLTFGYSSDVKGYEYSPEKAKQLLTEAGYPNGFKLTFKTLDGALSKIAEVVQENLSKVGITTEVQKSEKSALMSDLGSGNYEMVDMNIVMSADLDSWQMLFNSKGGFNFTKYSNPKVDELFNKGQITTDSTQRLEIYKQLLQTLNDDAPVVPICNSISNYVANKDLNIGYIDSQGYFYVKDMSWAK